MGAWTPEAEPASTGGGVVTLVEGLPSGVELRCQPRPLEDSYPA
jgi:hypothetical protein